MRDDWKPVLNYENDYEVNSEGVIRSIKFGKVKVMKTSVNNTGYRSVMLCKSGKVARFLVHRLVWEAFNGAIPKGMLVLHGEGNDKTITKLEYLSLGTPHENQGRDRRRDGTLQMKLTEEQVRYIKQRAKDGMLHRQLSKLFGVSLGLISSIKHGKIWKHVG